MHGHKTTMESDVKLVADRADKFGFDIYPNG